MNRSLIYYLVLTLMLVILASSVSMAATSNNDYFRVVDQQDNTIFTTTMEVHEGDWYIADDNQKYIVVAVDKEEKKVETKQRGEVKLLNDESKLPLLLPDLSELSSFVARKKEKPQVALYHTHGSESYVPDSGTDSKPGRGDIHQVVNRFTAELKHRGFEVFQSDNHHGPHDGGAYTRSRRTAKKLIQKRPTAIFDVHRDGVPNSREYLTNVNGSSVARVRLVVGRQNPNMKVNDKFAKQLKYVTDKYYPGLIKGIFYAKGDYNQDLAPHSTLLEFGTHTIKEIEAKKATAYFSDAVNALLTAQAQGAEGVTREQDKGAFKSILTILSVVIVGTVGYLVVNEGSLEGAVTKIKQLIGSKVNHRNDDEE
ncbi:MAG: stage II sporulation protein P [Bacillota bacterium]